MKKFFITFFLALIAGSSLAIPFLHLKKESQVIADVLSLYVLQTGVFKTYENALLEKEKVPNAVIIKDQDLYRVIVAASINETGLLKLENILKEEQIHYYKKSLEILNSDIELFKKYNLMLEMAENKETVLLLNQKILAKMVNI